jgi:endonuclease/exonuclease/phosphatase (EEP) superfamily protein YafD
LADGLLLGLIGLGGLMVLGAVATLALGRLSAGRWLAALLTPFRDHGLAVLAAGALLVVAGILGGPWALLLPGLGLLAGIGLWLRERRPPPAARMEGAGLALIGYNALRVQRRIEPAAAWLEAAAADLVFIVEAAPHWRPVEARLAARFPHQLELAYDPRWGERVRMLLLSRHPLAPLAPIAVPGARRLALEARVELPGRPIAFIGLHSASPKSRRDFELRDLYLDGLARVIGGIDGPVLAMGDFNAGPADPAIRRFLARSGLAGPVARGTWPAWAGAFGISIDHAFAKGGLALVRTRRGPSLGSDHRPIVVRARLEGAAPAAQAAGLASSLVCSP